MSSVKKIVANIASRLAPRLRYLAPAYSSEGEDLILKRIFDNKTNGVYVDVGAHHPFRVSNTYLFYKMKWKGINIDPMPGSKAMFDKYRPQDVNLEMGVSAVRQQLTYHIFNEPALNTFSSDKVTEYTQDPKYKVIRQQKIETWPLADILDHYLPAGITIDFLTIDAEGLDMDVLRSNNWQKYRPTYILVESNPFLLADMNNCELGRFMQEAGYAVFAKTYYTYFFKNMTSNNYHE
ncbi:FkbM family methyltransferase [Chitinophaga tropicalis]|uniref:SAM-dependent methyltransferase n=1 Tax=Chitinophaga tropicalis TaxID=2683588 RepID=A0A7K1U8B3_9BACT|nr:FkbM family methyltransferase [Chitinophaga tropicalis]MVT10614.1 SAM-dependent methyltransferase [Chitinophaga tropicalis]